MHTAAALRIVGVEGDAIDGAAPLIRSVEHDDVTHRPDDRSDPRLG